MKRRAARVNAAACRAAARRPPAAGRLLASRRCRRQTTAPGGSPAPTRALPAFHDISNRADGKTPAARRGYRRSAASSSRANQSAILAAQARRGRHWAATRCRAGCGAARIGQPVADAVAVSQAASGQHVNQQRAQRLAAGRPVGGRPPAGRGQLRPGGRRSSGSAGSRQAAAAAPGAASWAQPARPTANKAIRKPAHGDAPVQTNNKHSAWAKARALPIRLSSGAGKMVRPFVRHPGARSGAAGARRHAIMNFAPRVHAATPPWPTLTLLPRRAARSARSNRQHPGADLCRLPARGAGGGKNRRFADTLVVGCTHGRRNWPWRLSAPFDFGGELCRARFCAVASALTIWPA